VVLFKSPLYVVGQVPALDLPIYGGVEWWGVPLAPQSLTMHLFWAPQAFLRRPDRGRSHHRDGAARPPGGGQGAALLGVIAAAVFWSPYVAVGLAAVAAASCFGRGGVAVPGGRRGPRGAGLAARSDGGVLPVVVGIHGPLFRRRPAILAAVIDLRRRRAGRLAGHL